MKHRCLLILLALALGGCAPATPQFALYLVEPVSNDTLLAADPSALRPVGDPVIGPDDIVAYTWAFHEMELTDAAYARLQAVRVPVQGLPFVVRVGRQAVYAGAVWTPISSLSFSGVTLMQPFDRLRRSVRLEMGYPGPSFGAGADPRDDPRIRQALEAAGKLR